MLLTTTPTIEGCPIREYRGVVTGEAIIGANFVKDFFASLQIYRCATRSADAATCMRMCCVRQKTMLSMRCRRGQSVWDAMPW